MVELLRSNDLVFLSWATAVLQDAGIEPLVMDQHMSVLEGSIGALPRRLMVIDTDAAPARQALKQAGIDVESPVSPFG